MAPQGLKEELGLMVADRALAGYRNSPYYQELRSVFDRLTSQLPQTVKVSSRDLVANVSVITDPVVRVVDPLHVVGHSGEWYLRCWSHHHESIRIFALNRIQRVRVRSQTADEPAPVPVWIVLSVMAAAAGGRDEIAEIGLSRPVLFCFRSNTIDDLRAGVFASIAGCYPILLSGNPGVGKTEFARTLVASSGLTAHTLAAVHERGRAGGPVPAAGHDCSAGVSALWRTPANL